MNLDFSQWHPLDHWPGTRRCRQHYGGWRRHLHVAWMMGRRDQVVGWFARPTTCVVGRHSWNVFRFVREPGLLRTLTTKLGAPDDYTAVCRYCRRRRTATEEEWF